MHKAPGAEIGPGRFPNAERPGGWEIWKDLRGQRTGGEEEVYWTWACVIGVFVRVHAHMYVHMHVKSKGPCYMFSAFTLWFIV